ncbi:branched-chain amino acid ABC transporter substrate-binding protein [Halobacteriales archaeon QS_1_68_20]|nr:MAG: branched-chain amino acid ABC transporter substrate-binding protein [Halobacteriales archaeon QS_1_68_20]
MSGHHMTRRNALKAAGLAGATGVAGCLGDGGGGAEGTLRIGVLQPLTGDIQYYGQQSMWGFLSGLSYKLDQDPPSVEAAGQETIEGEDVTYELHIEDTQFDPNQAQDVATDLVEKEDVDVLFGTASSGSARQVIDTVTTAAEVPTVIGPAAAADITSNGEYCSDLVFRANENTAMDARSGGRYVAQETDVESVFIMAANYSFGKAVANNYKEVLEAEGIEIADIRYVERGYAEFEGLFDEAVDSGADAVIGGFTVATLPQFLSTGLQYDLRLFGGFATLISNRAVGGVLQRTLGEDFTAQDVRDAKLGPFTTRYHWNQYDNEINDWFVDKYSETYGTVPDLFTSGTFTAASSIVQAVEEEGSLDGDDIADGLKGMSVTDTPKGEGGYTYQEYNNQARSEMTIADPVPTSDEWADYWDATIMPGEPRARVSGEESTLPADHPDMKCDL